jgi:hypothetical protein
MGSIPDGVNFSVTQPFRPHYGLKVDSASTRNEYQEYFLGDKGGRTYVHVPTVSKSGSLNLLEHSSL